MKFKSLVVSLTLIFSGSVYAGGFKCPDMPAALTEASHDYKTEITTAVGRLGPIKAGELNVAASRVAKSIYEKFPDLSKVLTLQITSATYCSMLQNSDIPDKEKLDRWEKYQTSILKNINQSEVEKKRKIEHF